MSCQPSSVSLACSLQVPPSNATSGAEASRCVDDRLDWRWPELRQLRATSSACDLGWRNLDLKGVWQIKNHEQSRSVQVPTGGSTPGMPNCCMSFQSYKQQAQQTSSRALSEYSYLRHAPLLAVFCSLDSHTPGSQLRMAPLNTQ